MKIIKFNASIVNIFVNEFSEDFTVFNIFFEESDPELGGESWNFQRALGADGTLESLGEDDDGVCVVKEIQQSTFYEGIEKIELSKSLLKCTFDSSTVSDIGIDGLEISYVMDENEWEEMKKMASLIFKNREYFKIA